MFEKPAYLTDAKAAHLADPTNEVAKAAYEIARNRYAMAIQAGVGRRFKAVR